MQNFKSTASCLILFATLILCVLLLPTQAQAAEVLTSDDGFWSASEVSGGVEVTAYHGSAADVYIPATLEIGDTEYTVVKLGSSLFENNDGLNSATLAASILEVGEKAFYDCDNLVCVLLSESTSTIGASAFACCDNFNSIILYDAVTAIGDGAFSDCPKLTVWCNEGSFGYDYAVANAIPYQLLSETATPEIVTLDGIEYYILNGQAIAVSYSGSATSVAIPSTVNGHPVTELRETFKDNTAITAVTLSEGVKSVGFNAFYGCSSLQNIILPNSIASIGPHVFHSCTNLTSVVIPNSITEIPEGAFYGCKNLSRIDLPDALVSIGNSSFIGCKQLATVNFPAGLCSIGNNAFFSSGLIDIQFPSQLKVISYDSFRNCDSLSSVSIPDGIEAIGSRAFQECGSLTSVSIAGTVKSIANDAFRYCPNLSSVTISEGVERVGGQAFDDCPNLLTIILPKSIVAFSATSFPVDTLLLVYENSYSHSFAEENFLPRFIYDGKNAPLIYTVDSVTYYIDNNSAIAFRHESDTQITIPETVEGYPVTTILNAFQGKHISSISLPNSVTTIAPKAFYECTMLKSVKLSDNLLEIPENAFYWCTGLTSVSMPSSLEKIGANAFSYCRYLNVQLPNTVTSIGESAFYDTRFSSETLPEKLTIVKKTTFNGCKSLVNLTIPNGVTTIEEGAFANTSLASVVIPNSVKTIGKNAFSQITTLASIVVPATVTSISSGAFDTRTALVVYENSCAHTYAIENNLVYFIYDGITPVEIYSIDNVNYVIKEKCAIAYSYTGTAKSLTIPAEVNGAPVTEIGSIFANNTYLQTISIPDTVTSISNRAFLKCYSLTNVELPANLESISEGLFSGCTYLRAITLPNSVQTISASAFSGCSSLSQITMSASLVTIGKSAFSGCQALKTIIIPDSVTSIGDFAFYQCWGLSSVTLSNKLTSIERGVFGHCNKLTTITIPDNITSIKSEAFTYCKLLSSVVFSKNLTYIGQAAFSGCTSLLEINLPESLSELSQKAFFGCSAVKSLVIPGNLTEISDYAFQECTSLFSVSLPDSLSKIGNQAFTQCTSLTKIVIPESVRSIGNYAFQDCDSLVTFSIPNGVTSIGGAAFRNCDNLRTISIPASVTKIGSIPFTASVILLVCGDSYAHNFAVDNNLLYFVLRQTENPEISYGAEVSGKVIYSNGTPAANVSVEILYDDGVSKEAVTTDANGAYSFTYAEVGAYTIRATDASGNTASTAVSVSRMNVFDVFLAGDTSLTLKQGWSVSGTAPAEATVTLSDEAGNVFGSVQSTDGTFSFANVPNGTYILKAETATGSAVQEITVFNADLSGIKLTVSTDSAAIWGYVEVEDRELKHHRRNWVEVTLYNASGIAVAQCRSDKDGAYRFDNLNLGQYAVVARTQEMRPDKQHGFDRSHMLTGYAWVNAAEATEYQAETIVLYEENDHQVGISGKVTANGETQDCEVVLQDIFRNEIARYTTKKNGKYSFTNVADGLYLITATTQSDGMGYTVIAVSNGHVYGDTDIQVYKSDKVRSREDKFFLEVPDHTCREDLLPHRERIAEEKRWYDGLSEKEKKELSAAYVQRLDRYCQWLSQVNCETGEGITVSQSGLAASGDELANDDSITFRLEVTATEAHNASSNGVNNRADQIHHKIKDSAGKQDILQHYDISLYKDVDGTETQITSIQKDTDTTGTLRITLPIPEAHRGRRHYTIVHEHNGEVVTLADLDDDPNTITIEVDRFSTFVLTATDTFLTEAELAFNGANLVLHNDLSINFKAGSELFAEGGYSNPYAVFRFNGKTTTVNSFTESDGRHIFTFDNIAPNLIGEAVEATLYATKDGQLVSSEPISYSVKDYCYRMLSTYNETAYPGQSELRTLLVDLLNYGAASQVYTKQTGALVNADLTADQAAWGTAGTPELTNMLDQKYATIEAPTVSWRGAGLTLRDSVLIRLKISAKDLGGLSLKAVVGSRTYTIPASEFYSTGSEDEYYINFTHLSAHQMRQAVLFTVMDGQEAVSDTLRYSIESYIWKYQNHADTALAELVKAVIRYGDSAYNYVN